MRGLARASLLLALTMEIAGSGCVVTSSPEFTAPQLSPPFLTPRDPFTWQVLQVRSNGSSPAAYPVQSVTFDVVSEDLNTAGVSAVLLLDYPGPLVPVTDPQPPLLARAQVPPGHLDASSCVAGKQCPVPRPVSVPFTLPTGTAGGCHTVTILATHEFEFASINPKSSTDSATLTWYLNVIDTLQEMPFDPAKCHQAPSVGVNEAGTGADP